jgi:hypothetical protein
LDLRKDEDAGRSINLPLRPTLIAAISLAVAGILVAAVLPELLENDTKNENDPYSTPLSVILSSTVDSIEIEEKEYRDLTIPVAYYILLSEASSNMSGTDSITSSYIDFILGDDTPYTLTISTGQGWSTEKDHVISNLDVSNIPPKTTSQNVAVDMKEGQEVTLDFELKVWEVKQ